ncbi:MAG: hypothetical protein IJY80_00665, partial [Opitutales bacterium]|nr:hypothetical protein [Opitutales bacterium]
MNIEYNQKLVDRYKLAEKRGTKFLIKDKESGKVYDEEFFKRNFYSPIEDVEEVPLEKHDRIKLASLIQGAKDEIPKRETALKEAEKKLEFANKRITEEFVNDVVDRLLEHLKSVKSRKNRHLYTAEFDDAALLDWTKPLTEEQEDRIAAELAKTDPELAERIFASSEEIAAAKKVYEEADAEFYKAVEAYQNEENTGTSLIPSENVVAARERMHKADNKAKEAKLRLDRVKKLRGRELSSIHEAMRSPNDAKTLSKAFFRAGFVGHKFPAASMGLGNYSKGTNYVIYDESALQIVDKVSWLKNARGKVFGAYNSATKEVFIAKNARIDTVLHELGWHAMFDWASSNAPEFHAKMREYAASAPEVIKAQVRKAYPDLDEKSESFLDEVGAHAFSLDHYGKIEDLLKTAKDKTWWGKVKRLFQKIWKAFSKAIGKDRVDVAALSKMNYRDAVAQWAEDFVNGKRLQYPVDGS